jgi:hypothetical protein
METYKWQHLFSKFSNEKVNFEVTATYTFIKYLPKLVSSYLTN